MSLGTSLNNALSGLTATARAASLVSSNVSNVLTDGYGVREIALSSRNPSGVRIDGVVRIVDQGVLRERRAADSEDAYAQLLAEFRQSALQTIGLPEDPAGLGARIDQFEAALIEAAGRPDALPRLTAAGEAAVSLAQAFNDKSQAIQTMRSDADRDIAATVERLNAGLRNISSLNTQIVRARASNLDDSALQDQRQAAIDGISDIVPLRVIDRDNGYVALMSVSGATLLDIEPATFTFEPSATITADMTIGSGALSGILRNGEPVPLSGSFAPLAGGRLAALFEIRDNAAPELQSRLDSLARDLVERFQDASVDGTRSAGDPGLFTDLGSSFSVADEVGLSARLRVNTAILPDAGGAIWRLRDGLGAAAQGPVSDNALLNDLADALSSARLPSSGNVYSGASGASGLTADLISILSVEQVGATGRQTAAANRLGSMVELEKAGGVDTDQEMQKLLLIEQAYAANARVVSTVSDMLDDLMRI